MPADPSAPVVRDEAGPLDPQRVEQRDHVLGDRRLAVVAVGRLGRPSEPAQVHGEDVELAVEALDHPPPLVPVLREPVQRDQRRLGLVARVGDVGADAGREVVVAVGDAGQFGRMHPDGVPTERPGRLKSAPPAAEFPSMLLIAAIVLTAWVLLSVLVLTLCVAAGRADRAIELIMRATPEVAARRRAVRGRLRRRRWDRARAGARAVTFAALRGNNFGACGGSSCSSPSAPRAARGRPRARPRRARRQGPLGAGRQAGLRHQRDALQPRLVHAAQTEHDRGLLPGPLAPLGARAGVHGRRQAGHHRHRHQRHADLHADERAGQAWRLIRTYVTDPERATVLVKVRFDSLDGEDHGVEIAYDPQLYNDGNDDVGWSRGTRCSRTTRTSRRALVARPASHARAPATRAMTTRLLEHTYDALRPGNVVQQAHTRLTGAARTSAT